MAYDFFVARMKCPNCGETSPDDESTNMQTKIRKEPNLSYLRVGDSVEPAEPDVAYLTIRKPEPGEDIRILQTWECPNCNRVDNWAEIVIQGGIIRSIQPVSLNRETFRRANFIEDSAASVASRLLDIPINETIGMDVVQVLRERL